VAVAVNWSFVYLEVPSGAASTINCSIPAFAGVIAAAPPFTNSWTAITSFAVIGLWMT
jgi:hypothetical protein